MAAKDVLIVWFFVLPVLHCFWEKFVLRSKRLVECFNKVKISGLTNHSHRINAEISWQAKKLPVEFTNMEKYRRFQSKLSWLSEHPSFWNYFVNLEHCVTICDPRWRVSSFLKSDKWRVSRFWPGNPSAGFPAGFRCNELDGPYCTL